MIIIRFFTSWTGWGTAFAILLGIFLIGSAFSDNQSEISYSNSFYSMHEKSTFDNGVRKVGVFSDKNGNQYQEALYFQYGSNDSDIYRLGGRYNNFSGTVFVPEDRANHDEESGLQVFIYGDGKRLWASSHMQPDSGPETFNINITGVDKLVIKYDGGASTWYRPIAIGNISIGTSATGSPASSQIPMRLLDLPVKESTFVCRYTECLAFDYHGNKYEDAMLYRYGDEDDKDIYVLNGKYSVLAGTIFVPTDRGTISNEPYMSEMYYVRIYGDGELLYTSPQMVGDIKPVDFEVLVEGVNELTITYYGGAVTWMMDIALANLLLE